jgi:hypothetical protein
MVIGTMGSINATTLSVADGLVKRSRAIRIINARWSRNRRRILRQGSRQNKLSKRSDKMLELDERTLNSRTAQRSTAVWVDPGRRAISMAAPIRGASTRFRKRLTWGLMDQCWHCGSLQGAAIGLMVGATHMVLRACLTGQCSKGAVVSSSMNRTT